MQTPEAETQNDLTADLWHLILIGLCLVMMFQVIRVFVTSLVYAFGERYGQTLAAVPALLVFLSPFLIPPVTRLLSPRRLIFLTAGGLAVLRFLMQVSRDINLNLVLAGIAIVMGLFTSVLALSWQSTTRRLPTRRLVQGIFLGMTLEAALHGAFLTWDYVWQPGLIPLVTAFIVSALALLALWHVRSDFSDAQPCEHSFRRLIPIAALGPFFVLQILFFENVAFVASTALVSMEVALGIVLIGNAIAFLVPGLLARQPLPVRAAIAVLLVVIAVLLPNNAGIVFIPLILLGQAATATLLPGILSSASGRGPHPGIWRTSVVFGLASFLFVILLILYYISTLITLPFSYAILPPLAAIILLLTVVRPVNGAPATEWRLATLALVLLVLPIIIFITRPAIPSSTSTGSRIRLLDYNIHQAISFDGWLDPEGIARVVESQKPDIITFQEISRGWVIAGSLDVAEWLSRRLQMPYVYAPGHDYQFGNIIFTRLPVTEWSYTRLPLQNVPLGRALIEAKLDLGRGALLSVINTHLSAYAATEDRIPQVEKVLQVWNHTPRSLITGDMNAHPGDGDIALYTKSGLVSAQDVTGHPALLTFSSAKPVERIDWVFGTPDIEFTDFGIEPTDASDHLPVSVSFTLR